MGGAGHALGPPDSHSPNADAINSAFWVLLVVVVAVAVVINAALIVALVRFRERRGREPSRFAAGRGALRPVVGALSPGRRDLRLRRRVTNDVREIEQSGPNGLGAAQTAQVGVKGLLASAAIEGTESATGEEPITGAEPTETSPLQIDAIAQQWLWRFEYPGASRASAPSPTAASVGSRSTTVILAVPSSTDVLHTWWVPALGGQVQAAPGDVARTWFKADEEGRYPGRSTVSPAPAIPRCAPGFGWSACPTTRRTSSSCRPT